MYFILRFCTLGVRLLLMFAFVLILGLPLHFVYAETHLSSMNLNDGILTKEGNPFILDTPISFDQKLIIKEGVVLMTASSTNTAWQNYTNGPYIEARGGVEMLGTKSEPIHFIGLAPTLIRRPVSSRIEYAILENSPLFLQTSSSGPFGTTAGAFLGTTTIVSSKMVGSDIAPGLEVNSGAILVEDSEISENPVGILSDVTAYKTNITVRNSSIENNKNYNIKNSISLPIQATDNWWGSPDGPGQKIDGPVYVEPWKKEDPRIKKIECCSSVLFLPGLEASRLYRPESSFLGTSTNRLWEPNRNEDVRKLYLDENGASIDPTIYTKDVMESAFGLKNVYKGFFAMMSGVVADKIINSWLPFAYDWRMAVPDVVQGGTRYATTTKKLLDEVERLAETSKTGKVTIIAHSNGGLVAKMLGRELEKMGKSALIDRAILIASPVLGTPQAIAGLLHGSDQELLKGLVLKGGVARTLGLHMTGAYGLLPSPTFFNTIVDPVLSLSGQPITSYDSFMNFLTGKSDGRLQPKEGDQKTPAVLSESLLKKSQAMHGALDDWEFPAPTQALSLAGWGIPTTKSVEYSSTSPRIKKDSEGDGTVAVGSAAHFGSILYFNQGLFNFDLKKDSSHLDILETDTIKSLISKIVATTTLTTLMTSPYLSTQKPTGPYPWMKWLTVSVHSPVDMDIYDSKGKHMGLVPLPNATDSDLLWFENTIGGQYDIIGDEKYFTIPADETYTVKLKGTGVGNFTFQIQKYTGSEMIEVANVVYADLPVTPLLEASTTITGSVITPTLNLDIDGNGTADIKTSPNPQLNPSIHLDAMKLLISSLNLDKNDEKHLLQRIDKVRILLTGDKKDQVIKKIKNTTEKIDSGHWSLNTLTSADRELLTVLLDNLLESLETT